MYALFIGLIFFLGLTPWGLIPLGFINVTVLCIPTIVGTLVLGLKAGLLFGFFFGAASLMSVLGLSMVPPSLLAGALLAKNPVFAVLMCFVPRMLVPVTTHLIYRLANRRKRTTLSVVPAAVVGSLTNTVFYLGLMLLFYALSGLDSTPVLGIIGGTGLIAGTMEAVAAAVIATPAVLALNKLAK
ncbi:MAG TPA: ECF transporter S component [Feifaniaceae bacterium]|nr:ECF transporter S component [Feifaniaceae bacterium]